MGVYKAALAEQDAPAVEPKVRGEPGTFSRLTAQYFLSPEFLRLRTRTQHVYRLVIERFLVEHGHRRVAEMRRDDVKKIMALKAATPFQRPAQENPNVDKICHRYRLADGRPNSTNQDLS
jgi:hypothetical protein